MMHSVASYMMLEGETKNDEQNGIWTDEKEPDNSTTGKGAPHVGPVGGPGDCDNGHAGTGTSDVDDARPRDWANNEKISQSEKMGDNGWIKIERRRKKSEKSDGLGEGSRN